MSTSWSPRTGRRTSTPPTDCAACSSAWTRRRAGAAGAGVHPPRTRKRLGTLPDAAVSALVRFHEPFGFLDYNRLQLDARCVLSDSGTIAEESTILGFPAVTLRSSIERPEALDTGAITVIDLDPVPLTIAIRFGMSRPDGPERRRTIRSRTPPGGSATSSCPRRSSTSSSRDCGRGSAAFPRELCRHCLGAGAHLIR